MPDARNPIPLILMEEFAAEWAKELGAVSVRPTSICPTSVGSACFGASGISTIGVCA